MNTDRLQSLLRQSVREGRRQKASPECLGVRSILGMLDDPASARREDVQHLACCPACQWAVALARSDRETVEAPWSAEPIDVDATATPGSAGVAGEKAAGWTPPINLRPWLARTSFVAAIAAVLAVAVGLAWWRAQDPRLLGPVTGQLSAVGVTRADQPAARRYQVSCDLQHDAYMTFLYLDHTRRLQLPEEVAVEAPRWPAGPVTFHVTVTNDPPGPQWIAAIASGDVFQPSVLRDELQNTIQTLPNDTPFDELVHRLEQELSRRNHLSSRGHSFDVPPPDGR